MHGSLDIQSYTIIIIIKSLQAWHENPGRISMFTLFILAWLPNIAPFQEQQIQLVWKSGET